MQRCGIVMEISDGYAIVLTPDGQFCRIPNSGVGSVGSEVVWTEQPATLVKPGRRRQGRPTWMSWTAAATAACLAVAVGVWQGLGGFSGPPTAYAMVSLDINPSMTMQLSRNLDVMKVIPTDADGRRVVGELPSLKGASMQNAIEQVVKQAVADHLVPNADSIVIAAASDGSNAQTKVSSIVSTAEQTVQTALQQTGAANTLHPSVYGISVPQNVFDAANQANISPSKLATYLVALNKGKPVSRMNSQAIRNVFGNDSTSTLMDALGSATTQQITSIVKKLQSVGLLTDITSITSSVQSPPGKGNGHGDGAHPPNDGGGGGGGHATPSDNASNAHHPTGANTIGNMLNAITNDVTGGSVPPPDGGGDGGGGGSGGGGGGLQPAGSGEVGNLTNDLGGGVQNALNGTLGSLLGGSDSVSGSSSPDGRHGHGGDDHPGRKSFGDGPSHSPSRSSDGTSPNQSDGGLVGNLLEGLQ